MIGIDKQELWEYPDYVGRLPWFKFWSDKYATSIDLPSLQTEFKNDPKFAKDFMLDCGMIFLNMMYYFDALKETGEESIPYELKTRDARIIWNNLKGDIIQSINDYIKQVEGGRRGGRPKKENNEPKENKDDNSDIFKDSLKQRYL